MKGTINFEYQTEFRLGDEKAYSHWLTRFCESEGVFPQQLDYIFVDDEALLNINQDHLNHETYTDIITFDYSNGTDLLADIIISVERVKDNAHTYEVSFEHELKRVMCHGVLHMLGWSDKTDQEKLEMRRKEDEVIKLFHVKQ